MNFNEAIKQFPMIQRKGWNGKGLFVFMQVPSDIQIQIVPKMTSLPQGVKDEFMRRYNVVTNNGAMTISEIDPLNSICYSNQLAIVDQLNNIKGWAPSASDAIAEDWIEYKPE